MEATKLLEALPPAVRGVSLAGDGGPYTVWVETETWRRKCHLSAQEARLPIAKAADLVWERCTEPATREVS